MWMLKQYASKTTSFFLIGHVKFVSGRDTHSTHDLSPPTTYPFIAVLILKE